MAEDKEIRIRAVLDASTFDKGINEVQEKLRKIVQQQNQGAGAQKALGKDTVMGKYAQQAFGDFSKESQKQLEQMYKTQRQEAVNQSITMKGKQQELEKLAKTDGELTKQQQQRVTLLKQELDLLKEKHRQTLSTAGETQKALDKMGGGAGGPPPGAGGPSQQPPESSGPGKFKQLLQQIGIASVVGQAIGAAVQGVEDVITRDRKIAMNNAATMNMGSREMREGMMGQGSRGMFWASERAKAMRSAAQEQQSQSTFEQAKGWGGSALQLGGIGVMAATGWTGIGLGVGAGMTAAGTAMKGGVIGDERTRAAMFDKQKFNSMMTKEGMEKYEQNLAAEQAKDPRKQMAREYFEQNSGTMGRMQAQLGINTDTEYMGGIMSKAQSEEIAKGLRGGKSAEDIRGEATEGWMQKQMRTGGQYGGVNFSQATIEEQVQALGAGGAMTEGMRGMAGGAAAYNRQFNLTNAGQVMGKMQGNTGGNSQMTDAAYQKLLANAVMLGVDASTMPREMEKMTQMTAELMTSGGVNAQGMGQLFGAGLTGFNQKAMEAAGGAAEGYKATAKEAGGWEGQMGFGFLQSEKAKKLLGNKPLSAKQMNALNQTSAAELDEEGFERLSAYLDVPVDNVKQLLQEKDKFKQGRTDAEDKSYQDLQTYFKEQGADTVEKRQAALKTKQGRKLFEAAREERGATHGDFLQKTQVAQQAEILLQAGAEEGKPPTAEEVEMQKSAAEKVEAQKGKAETRAGKVEEGAVATGDMARMRALNENLDDFKKAAKGYTETAVVYEQQFALMVAATKKGATAMSDIANHLTALEKRMADENASGSTVPGAKAPGTGE